jgi:hypothetical protein
VYAGKAIDHPVDPYADYNRLTGKASLAGFDLEGQLVAGSQAPVRLYWLYQGLAADERLYVALLDETGRTWGRGDCQPDPTFGAKNTWQNDDIIESQCQLEIGVGTPPGSYLLRVGVETADGAQVGLIYPSPAEATVTVDKASSFPADAEIQVENRMEEDLLPQLELIGYDMPSSPFKPGASIDLTFYWRAGTDLGENYRLALQAKGKIMGQYAAWAGAPLDGRYPTHLWQAGEVVRDPWSLPLPTSLPGGDYILSLILLDGQNNQLAKKNLSVISIDGREHSFVMAQPPARIQVTALGDAVLLIGYDLEGAVKGTQLVPGQDLDVVLTWQAQATPDTDYVVFVQLLDAANQVRAQHDGQPVDNTLVTSTWAPGEYIRDSHRLILPADLEPGSYKIIAGMYVPDGGERLPVTTMNGESLGDYLVLGDSMMVR